MEIQRRPPSYLQIYQPGETFFGYLLANKEILENLKYYLPGQHFMPLGLQDDKERIHFHKFEIPKKIYDVIESNNISLLRLKGKLTPQNYKSRFQSLLWLEEAYKMIEMRRYDLRNATLTNDGNYLLLYVSGLADNGFALMLGDKMIITSKEPLLRFEGFIHKIQGCYVYIKSNRRLHSLPLKGIFFDVAFFPSRIPDRRSHNAIVQLGKKEMFNDIVFPMQKHSHIVSVPMIDNKDINIKKVTDHTNHLNEYQKRAVMNILRAECRPAPFIIFGPPGTGKTATMIAAVLQIYFLKNNSKILVCGTRNSSADLLAEKIQNTGVIPKNKMVRISAAYRMEKEIPFILKDITKDITLSKRNYNRCRIVITTCIQSGALNIFNDRFDYVFVDEAGNANEPETLIPLGLMKDNGCCVLAGDPHQLSPVCSCFAAGRHGLSISLLERLCKLQVYKRHMREGAMAYDERYIAKLIICYRSDPRVLSVNNEFFYDNELKFENKTPPLLLKLFGIRKPLVFHPLKGNQLRDEGNPSWYNPNEAIICMEHVKRFYDAGYKSDKLGVITPYRRQMIQLKFLFQRHNLKQCKIDTMEKFQGDERDIIIISTVRANHVNLGNVRPPNLGFLFDPKRFNVAISRAKYLVIVVGDTDILCCDKYWNKYIERAEKIQKIRFTRTRNLANSQL